MCILIIKLQGAKLQQRNTIETIVNFASTRPTLPPTGSCRNTRKFYNSSSQLPPPRVHRVFVTPDYTCGRIALVSRSLLFHLPHCAYLHHHHHSVWPPVSYCAPCIRGKLEIMTVLRCVCLVRDRVLPSWSRWIRCGGALL